MNSEVASSDLSVSEKFENLLVHKERVINMLGLEVPGKVTFEESEQNNARRQLLKVEKVAIRKKEKIATTEADFIEQAKDRVNSLTLSEIERLLTKPGDIFTKTLGLNDHVTALLEALSLRASSISQLEPLVAELPWLQEELLRMVNSPKYRRKDASGKPLLVETLRTALSFVGIENLQLIFPALVLRRSLPPITDPYPQIKKKVWRYAMTSSLTSLELAKFVKHRRPYDIFVLTMLSHLGRCAIARLYFRTFDQVHRQELEHAQREKDRKGHASLTRIEPCANYFIALADEYADRIASELFDYMGFRRINIANPMRNFAMGEVDTAHDAPERILTQARAYAKYRLLNDDKFISKEEAVELLSPLCFPQGALEMLKKKELLHLPIEIEEPKR